MSAYGSISRPSGVLNTPLSPTLWRVKNTDEADTPSSITLHHFSPSESTSALVETLYEEFADEVERGVTYPQEVLPAGSRMTRDAFEAYFFSGDVFVGITIMSASILTNVTVKESVEVEGMQGQILDDAFDLNAAKADRTWAECVAGFYYIKPNYPGRSSHICNGGFVVPFFQRGKGFSWPLALSFIHYVPKLGYEASVFNLVYVNNLASVRLWRTLNFTQTGLVPRAGRLRRKDGQGEEYVDAFIFYRSFLPAQ